MRSGRPLVIFYHFLFWVVLVCIPPITLRITELITRNDTIISPLILIYLLLLIGVFYFNAYFLLPKFLFRRKFLRYALLAILTLLTIAALQAWVEYDLNKLGNNFIAPLLVYFFLGIIPLVLSTAYRIIETNIKEQRRKQEVEHENIRAELSLLRSQVSPHFMFNVLNTLVALIRQRSDQLEPTVVELSNLMRYMLYDSDEEKVSLETEIEYLKSYIDLQQLRFGNKVAIHFNYPQELPGWMLEPMLLIPLVENAFKHGVNVIRDPALHINLQLKEGELEMHVANRYKEPSFNDQEKRNSGIGLTNLQRRLNILYPDAHELQLTKEADWFRAYLRINLQYKRIVKQVSPAIQPGINISSIFKVT